MTAAFLKYMLMFFGLCLAALVFALLMNELTCIQGSGMVVDSNQPIHECKCKGWQIKLSDQRAVDGPAEFLCLGIPE